MAFTRMTDDVELIQKLDDNPSDSGADNSGTGPLTADELKKQFDEAGRLLKKYINERLLIELEATLATDSFRVKAIENLTEGPQTLYDVLVALVSAIAETQSGVLLNNSIDADKLQTNSVTSTKILNGSVTTDKIDDGAVTGAKIATGTIPLSALAEVIEVDGSQIAPGAVDSEQIADGAVLSSNIGNGEVKRVNIEAEAVDNTRLANAAVTLAKIAIGSGDDKLWGYGTTEPTSLPTGKLWFVY